MNEVLIQFIAFLLLVFTTFFFTITLQNSFELCVCVFMLQISDVKKKYSKLTITEIATAVVSTTHDDDHDEHQHPAFKCNDSNTVHISKTQQKLKRFQIVVSDSYRNENK